MNLTRLEARFRRDAAETRLGNLASSLARISSAGSGAEEWPVVVHNIRECKYFIEWMTPELPQQLWETMVALQLRLSQIERAGIHKWVERTSDELRQRIRELSDALIHIVLAMRIDPGFVPASLPEALSPLRISSST